MKSSLFAVIFAFCATLAHADIPFSKYGAIQNVQNYSSNPFWNPNAPYNQRMPTAVYATGPDVETSDCQTMVAYLVASECATRNKCISSKLSDIRPAIILQLSRIPNGNYATSCAGYIDTAFDAYVTQNAIAAPSANAAFPTASGVASVDTTTPPQFQNPYTPKLQDWQHEMLERQQELKDLQTANGVTTSHLVHTTEYPTVYADLSFEQRKKNATDGYEPFKNSRAYIPIEIEKMSAEELWCKQNDERHEKLITILEKIEKCRKNKTKYSDCDAIKEYTKL
ncbi:MAG: hypothetical protein IIV74_02670 [Alphaproteobacteria bacterium]|nr:hypothetical protein [Alphaproteobacteria bacterium]